MSISNHFIIYDLEYTSWEGCHKNGWDETKNQFKEIVQIGAVKADSTSLEAIDTFSVFCKPVKNPILSEYFVELTGIEQSDLENTLSFSNVLEKFTKWVGESPIFAHGEDFKVIELNCYYNNISNSLNINNAFDLKSLLAKAGFPIEKYYSGNLSSYYGLQNIEHEHEALGDAFNILKTLQEMKKRREYTSIINTIQNS
jgi:inhibitor of KinA sporulation pathway (predicted exonuclease)